MTKDKNVIKEMINFIDLEIEKKATETKGILEYIKYELETELRRK